MMDDILKIKHAYEQWGYAEIRAALQQDFLSDPDKFVRDHGKRPEDLTGAELREFYSHFLVQQRPVTHTHVGFVKRFLSGELFPRFASAS